jgi:hypothetical protein
MHVDSEFDGGRMMTERREEGENANSTRLHIQTAWACQNFALNHELEVIVDETSGELVRGDQRRSSLHTGRCKSLSFGCMLVTAAEKHVIRMRFAMKALHCMTQVGRRDVIDMKFRRNSGSCSR